MRCRSKEPSKKLQPRTKVTEYDLTWARAGNLNLSHEEVEKMVFRPFYRHSLGIIILAATYNCRYPGHEGKKLSFTVKKK